VPEILDFYGPDAMLLIGGSLLAAREYLTDETGLISAPVTQTRLSLRPYGYRAINPIARLPRRLPLG